MEYNYRLCKCNVKNGLNKFIWKVTNYCNLTCLHCDHPLMSAEEKSKSLDFGQALELIDFISRFKPLKLLFTGGEPLIRRDVIEIARYAKEKGLNISLCTNGSLADKKMAEQIALTGFDNISISADGDRPKEHNALRGGSNSFDKTLAFVQELKKYEVDFAIHIVLNPLNFKRIKTIIDFWGNFTPKIEVGALIEKNKNFPKERFREYYAELPTIAEDLLENTTATIVGFLNECPPDLCPNGFSLFEITPDGYFRDCYWKKNSQRKPIYFKQLAKCKTVDELRNAIYQEYLGELKEKVVMGCEH